jgi:hypothetical protein
MRCIQPAGARGSLKWIQSAVNERWSGLERPILRATRAAAIRWLSPLAIDEYAEYRDADFLRLIGHGQLVDNLSQFWPPLGPQWDALGVTDTHDVLIVEAKAHIRELCSPGTGAGGVSRARIEAALDALAVRLDARRDRASWSLHFYQLANRIAHLDFLRSHGVPAWLVLVGFVGDEEMRGPTSAEAWRAAYDVALHVMGLRRANPLSRYIIHAYPDVRSPNRRSS